jgi:hypothetical protein
LKAWHCIATTTGKTSTAGKYAAATLDLLALGCRPSFLPAASHTPLKQPVDKTERGLLGQPSVLNTVCHQSRCCIGRELTLSVEVFFVRPTNPPPLSWQAWIGCDVGEATKVAPVLEKERFCTVQYHRQAACVATCGRHPIAQLVAVAVLRTASWCPIFILFPNAVSFLTSYDMRTSEMVVWQ